MMAQLPAAQVLVIEPSLTLRCLLEVALTNAGYRVLSYPQPGFTFATLCQQARLPHTLIVLSERQAHPGPDGWQLLSLFHQQEAPPRILFLLEEPGVLSRIEARLAGACTTLAKPFRMQDLLPLLYAYSHTHS